MLVLHLWGLTLIPHDCILFSTGSSLSDQVYQTPADMYNKGQTAKIKCSHSIENYNQILWYKQMKDGKLQFLGYMYSKDGYPEAGLNVKIEGSANKDKTCTLTIEGLNPNSSAVYFCAARYTVLHITAPQYKNLISCFFIFVLQLTASYTTFPLSISLLRLLYWAIVHLPAHLNIIHIMTTMTPTHLMPSFWFVIGEFTDRGGWK